MSLAWESHRTMKPGLATSLIHVVLLSKLRASCPESRVANKTTHNNKGRLISV